MSVFLRKQKIKDDIYLSLIESIYSTEKQNSIQRTIRKIGYVSELKKTYTDPVAYFEEEAKKLSIESQNKYKESKEEKIPREQTIKNLGYFPIARLYDNFKMKDEFEFITNNMKFKFDNEMLFRFLVYSQIINPGSKKFEYENKNMFLDDFNFSDDQMYDGINFIGSKQNFILQHITYELNQFYKPQTKHTYFDCTNIYFEIDKENDFQKRGPEKNNRHDPIIGLGLLMDSNGIPLSYTTFPGNQSEQPELHKNGEAMKRNLGIKGKTIYVADKGLNSGDNMYKSIQNGDGYVVGQKVRGADSDTIKWILDENGYNVTQNDDGEITYKIKSIVGEYEVNITSKLNGQKAKIILPQKRVVFYSKDYADKARYEREKLIAKAYKLISNPKAYKKRTVGDAATYIKEINYDKDGNIINATKLTIDTEAIENEAKLDGYYMVVTSETQASDDEIIKTYRGLWEIEESFSIIKGVLKVRPVFAKTRNGIEAHLLVCFFSLLLLRLLQKTILKDELTKEQQAAIDLANKRKTKHKIRIEKVGELPMKRIVNFLRTYNAQKVNDSYFIGYYNPDIELFENKYNLILDRHRLSYNDIKKIFDNKIYNTRLK